MPELSKTRVPVALSNRSKLDLPYDHVTTSDFMYLRPVFCRETLPTEKGVIDAFGQFRLNPLAVPTYGRCRMNLRLFWVPFRTIMPNWDAFYNDTIGYGMNASDVASTGLVEKVPFFTSDTVLHVFSTINILGIGALANQTTNTVYDYRYLGTNYKFTAVGKACFAIFESLGYKILPCEKSDSTPMQFSALKLLAFAKVWMDWYSSSAYLDSSTYLAIEQLLNTASLVGYELTDQDFVTIFSATWKVAYDGDYFTAQWDNPVAPNQGLFSSFSLGDISYPSISNYSLNSATSSNNGTPLLIQGNNQQTVVATQYSIEALHSLTDFMKRNQLSGARAVDRYLARFGVQLKSEALRRSIYLGNTSIDTVIGDVMSHANTTPTADTSNLGDFAGRGDGKGSKVFDYNCEGEFGVLLMLASILPSGGYYQGYDRSNRHLTKQQFFVPEFDGLGTQSCEKGELYISRNDNFVNAPTDYANTFGFLPTYAEYKVGRSLVTGDYSCPASNQGANSWHLMRTFDDDSFSGSVDNVVHSLDFTLGSDRDQYDRIFEYTGNENEHFNCFFHFDVHATANTKSLFDTYEFEQNSDKVTLQTNGVKVN